jgi:hypothetical protein
MWTRCASETASEYWPSWTAWTKRLALEVLELVGVEEPSLGKKQEQRTHDHPLAALLLRGPRRSGSALRG